MVLDAVPAFDGERGRAAELMDVTLLKTDDAEVATGDFAPDA